MESKVKQLPLHPVRGTQDYYPEEQRVQLYVKKIWADIGKQFAFDEYDSSVLDRDLPYKIKSGDAISAEMFQVNDSAMQEEDEEDKGEGREDNGKKGTGLVLRPEMTQILARMVMAKYKSLTFPLRWMAFPVCYRNETTQKGRRREFTQANFDIIGVSDTTAEIELFSLLIGIFKALKFTSDDIVIKFSDRRLLEAFLAKFGVSSADFAKCCDILDRIEKVKLDDTLKDLKEIGISEENAIIILDTLKQKSLESIATVLLDGTDEKSEAKQLIEDIRKLQVIISDIAGENWLVFDPSIVRGLAYYTGTVFEGFSKTTDIKRAVCGGGRYDNLLSIYDPSMKIPAIGFGMGDIIIVEMLKQLNTIPENVSERILDNYIFPYNSKLYKGAFEVANLLRNAGQSVDVLLGVTDRVNVKKAFDNANNSGATRALFIAPDEYEKQTVAVKYLRQKDSNGNPLQKLVNISELADLPLSI